MGPAVTFSIADHAHMARALELAGRGLNSTAPNPAVGCVLLDAAGQVVGEAWHARAGEPHAEVLALGESQGRERKGTAYVTLEPCSHHGRTPPCVDAVIAASPRRVVVAMQDPNPRVAGAGLQRLRAAGIDVDVGLLAAQAAELNRGFVSRMSRGRPWVTVKLGTSLDGRTALADGSSQWITGAAARADVQRLRARASAIVTGIGTALADDPALTVRDTSLDLRGREPLRAVLDSRGRLPPHAKLASGSPRTLVLTSEAGASALGSSGVASRVDVDIVPSDAHGRLSPAAVLARLAGRDCNEVLVEAGAHVAGSFLDAGVVDEIVIYVAPTVLGGTGRAAFELPRPLRSLQERRLYAYRDVRSVGADLRLTLRPLETTG